MVERHIEQLVNLPFWPLEEFGRNFLNYYHQESVEIPFLNSQVQFNIERTFEVDTLAAELSKDQTIQKPYIHYFLVGSGYKYRFLWTDITNANAPVQNDALCLTKDYLIQYKPTNGGSGFLSKEFDVVVQRPVFKKYSLEDYIGMQLV